MAAKAYESVSTWRQPEPAPASHARTEFVRALARRVHALGPHRLRVVIDGYSASGKTSFGHELASALRLIGRPTLRASLDDFKRPWSEAHLYDRKTGEGYYRNAQDVDSAVRLLLLPAGRDGNGKVALCSIDPLTQQSHADETVLAPDDAVLIVDGVFALRPAFNRFWDFRIWLDIDLEEAIARGVARDQDREGAAEAQALHRDRYAVSEQIYIAEVQPVALADAVIDNRDFAAPSLIDRP